MRDVLHEQLRFYSKRYTAACKNIRDALCDGLCCYFKRYTAALCVISSGTPLHFVMG
jgi:hypothetical protein